MTLITKLTFLSLLWMSFFFTSGNWQRESNLLRENPTVSAIQSKIIKPQSSVPVGNVSIGLEDKKGNIWFVSTGKGVYRYNTRLGDGQGQSFTNFTTRDGLISDMVLSIMEDKEGDLWFGTDSGVSHYDGKTFTDIPIPDNFVTSILEDKSGKLWFATRNGVYWYNARLPDGQGKAFTRFLDDQGVINRSGLALRVVQSMLEDKQGNIWITTKDEGICRYDGKSIINYTPNDVTWFRALFIDKDGTIWAGGKNIVCRFDARLPDGQGKTFTSMTQDGRFDSSTVYSITQDKSGNMWFGTEASDASDRETEGGVWVYNGTSFKHFSKKDGLSHNAVWFILEDKSGMFWFGTRRGLSRYDGKTFIALWNKSVRI
ncbi:MAG: ligand-binding sensor domain-containing protein [Daejeonella sp.]|uniref:ligand-binding sensor domain-containing protein n=1 Tax=Daejeonella sp. JGW-45 TaxID=3034148 RepID=UPI0023EE0744|nr:two-component regulator propeller domain-containing protein [Daejeonella sp. JGW-45]